MHTLSQYMLSSAATFGFFLSIGSVRHSYSFIYSLLLTSWAKVIRNDAHSTLVSPHLQVAHMQLRSRAEGAAVIRARWDMERDRAATA